MRTIYRLISIGTATILSGCASGWHLPEEPSKTDLRMVYVWPTDVCPSLAAGGAADRAGLVSALGATFAGNFITALLGIPSAALSAAVNADKNGFQASGTNARFYFTVDTSSHQAVINRPACYVIAYTYPDTTNQAWCDDKGFKIGVADTCLYGRTHLKELRIKAPLTASEDAAAENSIDRLKVPQLYMEVGFVNSGYADIYRPQIVAMYYPKSLLSGDTDKPRALTLQIDSASPLPQDPLKAAQIVLLLPHVTPAAKISDTDLGNLQSGWATIPSKGITAPTAQPKGSDGKVLENYPYLPVTMSAKLSEIGDPNVFLAALAQAYSSSVSDFGKTISGAIVPQQVDTNKANYLAALGTAQGSLASFIAACSTNPPTSASKALAKSLFEQIQANQLKANIAAQVAGESKPYSNPNSVDGYPAGCPSS